MNELTEILRGLLDLLTEYRQRNALFNAWRAWDKAARREKVSSYRAKDAREMALFYESAWEKENALHLIGKSDTAHGTNKAPGDDYKSPKTL